MAKVFFVERNPEWMFRLRLNATLTDVTRSSLFLASSAVGFLYQDLFQGQMLPFSCILLLFICEQHLFHIRSQRFLIDPG